MNNITDKEKRLVELLRSNPYFEQEELAAQIGTSRSSIAGHIARLVKKGILQRGYILKDNLDEIAVIGGSNIDIKGISKESFRFESSNPGDIIKSAGGVGRNVASNLGKLQIPTSLYSAVGSDDDGEWLIRVTNQSGVNTQHMFIIHNIRTGMYLSILNDKKEQIGSIADMKIMDRLDKDFLINYLPSINRAKMVFIDSNLSSDTLNFLLKWLKSKGIPIAIDPVSAKKALKLKGLLKDVELFTPNIEEAEVITGMAIQSDNDLRNVANYFLEKIKVNNIVITLGDKGVYVANDKEHKLLPSPKVNVVDTTGAGDAFIAGVIYGLNIEKDIFEACKYGSAMAAITLSRAETVADDLSVLLLENKRKELY